MPTLQENLDTLNTELDRADGRIQEVEGRASQAGTALDVLRGQLSAQSQKVLPLASAVTTRLDTGRQQAEDSLNRLHGDLDGLEKDMNQRRETTQARVRLMMPAVQQLSAALQRVHGEFRTEQKNTEDALSKAGERSQVAFKKSRDALQALDLFVREDYLPRLGKHEESTQLERDNLSKKVVDVVLPAIEKQVKDLKAKIDSLVESLREQSKTHAGEAQKNAEECLADTERGASTMVKTLAGQTEESARALAQVTSLLESGLGDERKMEQALLQSLVTAVPHAEEVRGIPVRLEEVLKKARVIR